MKIFVLLIAVAGLTACSDHSVERAPHGIEIQTAALNLPGIDFACYDLLVQNGLSEPVLSLGDPGSTLLSTTPDATTICSTQYGNGAGGEISYIAPCDASETAHTVTIWVDGLYTGTPAAPVAVDHQDPCPGGCTLDVTCVENADVFVEFNLTIMRPANQGFFDVAVNFDDIFCSAKVDCTYPAGPNAGPIELLFNPTTGKRAQTVVLGFACTGGPAATAQAPNDTVLLRDPILVECGGLSTVIDPSVGDGNAYTARSPDPDETDAVWQYAIYAGSEDLDCAGVSCNKRYWNVAIGFDPTVSDCTLTTSATAGTPDAFDPASPFASPDATVYPLIDIDIELTGLTGGLACSQHPLNTQGSGVATRYTAVDVPELFCGRFEGSVFTCSEAADCPVPAVASVVSGNVVNDSIADAVSPMGLARARNGDLFVAFHDRGDAAAGAVSYLTRSTDIGQTWEQTAHVVFGSSDPLVGVAAGIDSLPNGDLVVIAMEHTHVSTDPGAVFLPRASTIRLHRSTDDGATFAEWQTLDVAPFALTAAMGRIVQLSNGDLIIPAYTYTKVDPNYPEFQKDPAYKYGSGFFRSTNGGSSWGPLELAFTDPPVGGSFMGFNEAAFVVRSDGSIVAQARVDRPAPAPNNLWYVESFDDGVSWTAPQETNVRGIYPAVARISDCSYVMVAGDRGWAVPRMVRVYKSRDGINYEPSEFAPYSRTSGWAHPATGGAQSMVRLPDGSFYVVYYAHGHPTDDKAESTYIEGMLLRP
jgi:hypothetical protein